MKILIQNFNSTFSNEAIYLNNFINRLDNQFQCELWNSQQQSVFDTLDRYSPDVLICHVALLSTDLVKYLNTEQGKNINLVLNITGNHESLDNIEQSLAQSNLKPIFMYSNDYKFTSEKEPTNCKFTRIYPSLNVDQIDLYCPDFTLSDAIIATEKSELFDKVCSQKETYHKIKLSNNRDDDFDVITNITTMNPLYPKYETITLVGKTSDICGQVFFESMIKAKKVVVNAEDNDNFNKFLEEIFVEEDYNNDEEFLNIIKKQILNNHTCVNRTEQLLKEIQGCLS